MWLFTPRKILFRLESSGTGTTEFGTNMNKFIAAILLFTASAFSGVPYLTEPTNSRVDTYIPSATGPNQKWVPYLNVTNAISNIVIRPGPGITISTNVNGVDYTVNGTTNYWFYDARTGGITNSRGPVEITNSLWLLGPSLIFTNGSLAGTHYWSFAQALNGLTLGNDGVNQFAFNGNLGTFGASNFITPTNGSIVGYIPTATSTLGDSKWSPPSPFVDAGTNITLVTNGPVVTINSTSSGGGGSATNAVTVVSTNGVAVSSAATNIDFWPGTGISLIATNRSGHVDLAVSSTGGGVAVSAGTNITATTNSGVVTLSVSTNPVVIAGTNVTVQTNGLAYTVNATSSGGGSGVGPGTAKRVAMFDSTTTNVTDSSLINSATNQIEFRQTNVPYASTMTNYLVMGVYTNGTGFRGFEIDSDATGFINMEQQLGSGVNPATFSRAGIRFNQAWAINGWGSTATGDGNGKTPDFLPVGDNVHDVGSTSARVKSIFAGSGFFNTINGSSPNFGSISGYGLGMTTSAIDFYNAVPTKIASFYVIPGLGGNGIEFPGGGIAGSASLGTPDVYLHRPVLYRMWSMGTNNSSTTKTSPVILSGSVSDDNAVNRAGGDLVLAGGPASGSGTNGNVSLATFMQGSSGFGYGSLQTNRLVIHGLPTVLTTNSATTVLSFTVPTSLTCVGAKFSATTEIKDATDIATLHEEFSISAVNKAGTVTATNSVPSISSFIATGSAGVTTTWTVTVSSTTVSLKCNAVTTGINATTARLVGSRFELDSDSLSNVQFEHP
jgi:hypothetical protein